MRNVICALGVIVAMGLGTTAAATNAFKTVQKDSERRAQVKPRLPRELKAPGTVTTAAGNPPAVYEERTIPAPSGASRNNAKVQPPTKQLSRTDRRQA